MKKGLYLLLALMLLLAACESEPVGVELDALPEGDAANGEALFSQNIEGTAACSTCHALTDTDMAGPGLEGYGERAGDRVDGESAEEYTFYSILRPTRHVVSGFSNVMPKNYEEVLSEQQLADLIAYLLTL